MLEVLKHMLVSDGGAKRLRGHVLLGAGGEVLGVGADLVEGGHGAIDGLLVCGIIVLIIAGGAAEAVVKRRLNSAATGVAVALDRLHSFEDLSFLAVALTILAVDLSETVLLFAAWATEAVVNIGLLTATVVHGSALGKLHGLLNLGLSCGGINSLVVDLDQVVLLLLNLFNKLLGLFLGFLLGFLGLLLDVFKLLVLMLKLLLGVLALVVLLSELRLNFFLLLLSLMELLLQLLGLSVNLGCAFGFLAGSLSLLNSLGLGFLGRNLGLCRRFFGGSLFGSLLLFRLSLSFNLCRLLRILFRDSLCQFLLLSGFRLSLGLGSGVFVAFLGSLLCDLLLFSFLGRCLGNSSARLVTSCGSILGIILLCLCLVAGGLLLSGLLLGLLLLLLVIDLLGSLGGLSSIEILNGLADGGLARIRSERLADLLVHLLAVVILKLDKLLVQGSVRLLDGISVLSLALLQSLCLRLCVGFHLLDVLLARNHARSAHGGTTLGSRFFGSCISCGFGGTSSS